MKTTAKIMAMLIVLVLVGSASARVIIVEVEGVVDLLWTYDGFAFDDSVNIGSAITGFCTYDTDELDQNPFDHRGEYPLISISMSIGNYTFTHDPMSSISAFFEVSTIGNSYFVYSRDPRFDGTVYLDGIPKTFEDFSWTTFGLKLMYLNTTLHEYIPTDELPDLDSWPELSIFDSDKFIGVGTDEAGPGFVMNGQITSLTVVPESAITYYVNAAEGSDNNDGLSPETPFATIQKAIDIAYNGDTVIVADGTYTGPGNRDIDFLGKAITVRSINPDDPNVVEATIIDSRLTGPQIHRAFVFSSGEDTNSVLSGFTIIGYHVNPGGAICCRQSNPTIKNCIINGHTESFGGGIYCDYSSPTLINCMFGGNQALRGGAMLNESSNPTLTNCMFIENSAEEWGGGMYNWFSNPTLNNCTFIGNSAGFSAGGIYNYESNPILTNCTFIRNYAEFVGAMNNRSSNPTLKNCTFSGNSAIFWAGGMGNYESSPNLTNCLFSGNTSRHMAGAMFNNISSLTLTNCTFFGNSAKYGSGIEAYGSSLTLTNSILWDNASKQGSEIYLGIYPDPCGISYPSTVTIQYTDVECGHAAVYVEAGCTLNWGQGNIDADPRFIESGYWADANDPNIITELNDPNAVWLDGDYHLLPDSLCIDTGDPNYIPEPNETDLDGNPRVNGGRIDIGAYETNYIQAKMKLTPQMLNCNSKGKYVKAHLTLPEAFLPADVDINESAMAVPMGAESEYIKVLGAGTGPVRLEICFDRETFCAQITETGEIEITVIGSLTTGRYFYASDTIKIKPQHQRIIYSYKKNQRNQRPLRKESIGLR